MIGEAIKAAKNPILPGRGVCDPHVRIFDGTLYLYASHDASPDNADYCMNDWQIWSTRDAIDWTHVATVHPEDTFMGASDACWATDACARNGQYYFYFSNGAREIGVMSSPTPSGPFRDAIGKPMIAEGSTPTMEYDPHVFVDDDGTPYLAFGGPAWAYRDKADGYYLARLDESMTVLAETPRKLALDHRGDDKVALHKWNGIYYLSWASHYATSDSVYGPYRYRGNIGASKDHGTFFYWNNQWFNAFTIFDPTLNHRATGLCHVAYRKNGEMAPVESLIVENGVGHYDASWHRISAAWYMSASRYVVQEGPNGGFEAAGLTEGDDLTFPNIRNMPDSPTICFFACCTNADAAIEIWSDGHPMGTCNISTASSPFHYNVFQTRLPIRGGVHSLTLTIRGVNTSLHLDSFRILP